MTDQSVKFGQRWKFDSDGAMQRNDEGDYTSADDFAAQVAEIHRLRYALDLISKNTVVPDAFPDFITMTEAQQSHLSAVLIAKAALDGGDVGEVKHTDDPFCLCAACYVTRVTGDEWIIDLEDAERYRFLRNQDIENGTFPRPGLFIGVIGHTKPDGVVTHEEADEVIDRAREALGKSLNPGELG